VHTGDGHTVRAGAEDDPVVGLDDVDDLVADPQDLGDEGEDGPVALRPGWDREGRPVVDEVVRDAVREAGQVRRVDGFETRIAEGSAALGMASPL